MLRINATRNTDGKVVVNLYGTDFDVTDSLQDGVAPLRAFGKSYEVHVAGDTDVTRKDGSDTDVTTKKKTRKSKRRKTTEKVADDPVVTEPESQ